MTQPDKLTAEDIQKILSTSKLPITFSLGEQLLDTMRENERLLSAYKYGHQCLINVGFPNLAEIMALAADRHCKNNKNTDKAERIVMENIDVFKRLSDK